MVSLKEEGEEASFIYPKNRGVKLCLLCSLGHPAAGSRQRFLSSRLSVLFILPGGE